MTRARRIVPVWICLTISAAAMGGRAQERPQTPQTPSYQVQSQLVQVFLTVVEGSRRVTDVKPSEFSLSEDGKPQTTDHVDSEAVPLQIALLLDTSASMMEALPETQEAAVTFVHSMVAGDRVTLIPFNSNIRSIPQLTDDTAPILRAIRNTRAENKTKLYDAILYAIKILSDKEGRKAIVVFSDGQDTESAASLNLVLNAASRHGYPIFTVSAGAETRNRAFQEILRRLAEINNGKTFLAENGRELRSAFTEVALELRSAYVLYYYTLQSDERWHDLAVSVANPRYKVFSRKGFYSGKMGAAAASLSRKAAEQMTFEPELEVVRENAKAALDEVVTLPAVPRPIESIKNPAATAAETKPKATIKVESHLIEAPVLIESADGHEPPPFSQKDFQVFEDGSRKDIAYFAKLISKEDLQRVRDMATNSTGESTSRDLNRSSAEELILGKYDLVLDDITGDPAGYAATKRAAQEIITKYHSSVRPFSVYFTSLGATGSSDNVETMLDAIQKSSSHNAAGTNPAFGSLTVYEAALIDRGDSEAQDLAELTTAANLGMKYENRLGRVDGACTSLSAGRGDRVCDPSVNVSAVQANLRARVSELITQNSIYVRGNLTGLREVVNAAAADPGTYSKTIIFMSPGFVIGKGTRGDASSLLQSVAQMAKQRGIRIYAIDTGGSSAEAFDVSVGFNAITGSANVVMNSHKAASRVERASPLDLIASQTGGKRVTAAEDVAAAAGSALSSSGSLYYLAFLSRKPVDGRFHKIAVFASPRSATVKVHARAGYYARPQEEAASSASPEIEDVNALAARADQAIKSGDYAGLATALEGLSRNFADRPEIWFNLGVAYFNMGNPTRAVDSFQRSLLLSPDDRSAGLMLARSLAASGNPEAAVETLQAMRSRRPSDFELLSQLGLVYEANSQPAMAYEVYRSAIDVSRVLSLDFYVLLIRTSALLGRFAETAVFIDDYRSHGGNESRIQMWQKMIEPK